MNRRSLMDINESIHPKQGKVGRKLGAPVSGGGYGWVDMIEKLRNATCTQQGTRNFLQTKALSERAGQRRSFITLEEVGQQPSAHLVVPPRRIKQLKLFSFLLTTSVCASFNGVGSAFLHRRFLLMGWDSLPFLTQRPRFPWLLNFLAYINSVRSLINSVERYLWTCWSKFVVVMNHFDSDVPSSVHGVHYLKKL